MTLIGRQTVIIFPYIGSDGERKEVSAKIQPDQSDWWCSVHRDGKYFDIHYNEENNTINVYQVGKEEKLGAGDTCIHTIAIDPRRFATKSKINAKL